MSYGATTYRLLISGPSDVPSSDVEAIMKAIARWNANYGRTFGSTIVPLHWRLNSAARHGVRPQTTLNSQLVESVDILVALFWHRLGTVTGEATSGTVEEIREAHDSGAYVGVLCCRRPYPSDLDEGQLRNLRGFFESIRGRSLMLDYGSEQELTEHVDAIIYQAVVRSKARSEAALEQPDRTGSEVWPRIENVERPAADPKGRPSTRRDWYLVLANSGAEPALQVHYRLEAEQKGDKLPHDLGDHRDLEILAPDSEARYPLAMFMGVAPQARCVVSWTDSSGEHQSVATLRFF